MSRIEEKLDKDKLEDLMNKYYNQEDTSLSFFDIINRSHDENMMSLMIKYLFEQDNDALKNLINKAYNIDIKLLEIEEIITEYVVDNNKRIDILINAKIDGKKSVIVIENKVYSYEHDNQCQVYFDYIDNGFKTKDKYYLFLKPAYNMCIPNCEHFKVITYNDIYNAITVLDDIYINDFKKTISNNLVVEEMNKLDNYLLDNFKEIYNEVNSLDKKVNKFLLDEYGEIIKDYLNCESKEYYAGNYSIRFYNKDCWSGWKDRKEDTYYFYIELVAHDKNIRHPVFQRIIKRYSKTSDSNISRFLLNYHADKNNFDGFTFIIDTIPFESNKSILSPEWKEELIEKSKEALKPLFEDQKKDVAVFINNYLSTK